MEDAETWAHISAPHSERQLEGKEKQRTKEKVLLWSCQSFGCCKRLEQMFQVQTVHGDSQLQWLEHSPVGCYCISCAILMAMFKCTFSAQLSSVYKHQSRHSAGIQVMAQLEGTVSQPSAQEMVMESRANELQQLCAPPSISRWPQLLSCGLSACPGHTGSSVS